MQGLLFQIFREENGQGIAEYALILALMVLVCVAGFTALGPAINERITAFSSEAYE